MATAAPTPRRTPAQLAAEGFAALVEKLGLADAVRFVQLYDPGRGDYTRDRHQWLGTLTHDEVAGLMAQAEARRQQDGGGLEARNRAE
jgi:hypothetical protein